MKNTVLALVVLATFLFAQASSDSLSPYPHQGDSRLTGLWHYQDTRVGDTLRINENQPVKIHGYWYHLDSLGPNLGQISTLGSTFAGTYNIIYAGCAGCSYSCSTQVVRDELRIFLGGGIGTNRLDLVREPSAAVESGPHSPIAGVASRPNPFSGSTTLAVSLPSGPTSRALTLSIYDQRGRLIRHLMRGEAGSAGLEHRIAWNGCDDQGARVSTGTYIWKFTADGTSHQGRLFMVK